MAFEAKEIVESLLFWIREHGINHYYCRECKQNVAPLHDYASDCILAKAMHDANVWLENEKGRRNVVIVMKTKGDKMTNSKKAKERAVLVCTEHRGVFFGYATKTRGAQIDLKRARNVVYWPSANKGFVGLAADGPKAGAKVGPAADMDLRKITCVLECTAEAVEAFEKGPWA